MKLIHYGFLITFPELFQIHCSVNIDVNVTNEAPVPQVSYSQQ